MSETRKMTQDLYGLKGWFRGGQCVDHLVRGTEFSIGPNSQGKTCIFAFGREYAADTSLLYDARRKSELVRDA